MTLTMQDEPSDKVDIRDLEFALMNDVRQLRSRASSLSKRQVELVKLIICSALYPQFAIGDEHNPHRNSNELVFHTTGNLFKKKKKKKELTSGDSKELLIYSSYQCRSITS